MMTDTTRRDFLGTAALAAGGLLGGCATGKATPARPDFAWGALLHLGSNMWDDYIIGPSDWAKSAEEEKRRPNPYGPSGSGAAPSIAICAVTTTFGARRWIMPPRRG